MSSLYNIFLDAYEELAEIYNNEELRDKVKELKTKNNVQSRNSIMNVKANKYKWRKLSDGPNKYEILDESIDSEPIQYGVHQFSADSIIFRGTEEECGNYIDEHPELWDDAEVYTMTPDDPHYLKEAIDATKAQEYRKESDADVIYYGYQYKNEKPVEIGPEELSYEEFKSYKDAVINSKPKATESDFMFYILEKKKNEALNEWYPNDVEEIELEYGDIDLDDGVIDWTYDVDKDDLYTYIFESCITEEDFPVAFEDDFDPNNEEDWKLYTNWIEENFSDIYSKYETDILEHYRDLATDNALENYDADDYMDWDSMSGGHDDY